MLTGWVLFLDKFALINDSDALGSLMVRCEQNYFFVFTLDLYHHAGVSAGPQRHLCVFNLHS